VELIVDNEGYYSTTETSFKEILLVRKSNNEASSLDEVSDEEFQKILEDIRKETEDEEDRHLQEIVIK